MELDSRREVGILLRDATVVKTLIASFENNWESKDAVKTAIKEAVQEMGREAADR
jgi:hypothetical protein